MRMTKKKGVHFEKQASPAKDKRAVRKALEKEKKELTARTIKTLKTLKKRSDLIKEKGKSLAKGCGMMCGL